MSEDTLVVSIVLDVEVKKHTPPGNSPKDYTVAIKAVKAAETYKAIINSDPSIVGVKFSGTLHERIGE